ncbi:protein Smaug [Anopheles arabiensis]|uniref:protein Smaug n=1 Tax=Anopheles arabiensis TaxID=7173 RepID=UPI001AADA291|nr:protein Smaug [Anopheles arabiensis]XP_040175063.1 protein Smaug [Anopheles arabiensis]XP_040175064.1 protein Smaug [Anopheles arabiensis]XP_040175065.1 protein Smaug [Anopheles arabiensis]XP_040175066.1 protein Smaug [Anopheles arabiensis]XP_040175067.1 protein Smaug [Anopheles arabiensis]XP_040175068.1 protein Smaug [Anopheles arabiensis]
MKYPGGNPSTMFCEQVGTVTSLFEQWNDCERTVVLYALLKRVPFVNLKFLQVSIDYNLAQNYSTQAKLQQLETKANSTALLGKLVQRYYQLSGHSSAAASLLIGAGGAAQLNNNNNSNSVNNNLKAAGIESTPASLYELLKKASPQTAEVAALLKESPSIISATTATVPPPSTTPTTATVTPGHNQPKGDGHHHERQPETKEDILKDILMYLPLLAPGNDEAKSLYMSLIPAAVDDACRQLVPTEIVQQTLSYLLIHPAITNDDRRVLSHWLRYLEDFISTSYLPAPATAAPVAKGRNYFNVQQSVGANGTSSSSSLNSNGTAVPVNTPHVPYLSTSTSSANGGVGAANSWTNGASAPGSQIVPGAVLSSAVHHPQQQHHHQQHHSTAGSVLSKSQQSLNNHTTTTGSTTVLSGGNSNSSNSHINNSGSSTTSSSSSSTTSSSSCLDSAASQLLKATPSPRLLVAPSSQQQPAEYHHHHHHHHQTADEGKPAVAVNEFSKTIGQSLLGSSQTLLAGTAAGNGGGLSVSLLPALQQQQQQQSQRPTVVPGGVGGPTPDGSASCETAQHHHDLMAATESLLYDSTDDDHISFSKNGTEIFDYDCDFDNEDEFNYLARNAAAIRAAEAAAAAAGNGILPASASSVPAGSGVPGGGAAGPGHAKKLVSFNSNVNDFLRVPPLLASFGQHSNLLASHGGGGGGGGGLLDLELDASLMKTRRSNSLTTPSTLSALGVGGGELSAQQKQNNECLSAENLSNLQLLQNKPRSFSLTMESPRSSLASSGSDTQLDDYKQGAGLMKLYGGQPNVGMSSIAHWLKSLRLHKYVWLFSNLTYDKMLGITEEYLQSLGVTKGARHKLAICIQKLKERYGTLLQLEKDLIGGQKAQLGTVLEELTNIVLTPMKPIGMDQPEDIAAQFAKVLDLVGSIIVMRPVCSQQDEEYLNIFLWIVERALHNDAFIAHSAQLKDHKYKVSKIKMQIAPKSGGHFAKSVNVAGPGMNKPRWTTNNKHKPVNVNESQAKSHRKSSVPYFVPPGHLSAGSHLQSAAPSSQVMAGHPYFHHGGTGGASSNAGGSTANYNKSSSYPSFASTLHGGGSGGTGGTGSSMKPILSNNPSMQQTTQHLQQQQQPHPHKQSTQPPTLQPPAMQHPSFMFHRHSLSNITHHHHNANPPLVPPPAIFLNSLGGSLVAGENRTTGAKVVDGGGPVKGGAGMKQLAAAAAGEQAGDSGSNSSSSNHNNSIIDINSRLEFLCRQMTEQAIN